MDKPLCFVPDWLGIKAEADRGGGGRAVEPHAFSQTESRPAEIKRTALAKMEICAIPLAVAGSNPAVDRLPTRRKQTSPKLTSDSRAQPEIATGIFLLESLVTH